MKKILSLLTLLLLLSVPAQKAPASGSSSSCVTLTDDVVVMVLKEAALPFNCTLQHLWGEYQNGTCSVIFDGKDASGYWFRVESGGLSVVILIGTL